MKNFLHRHQEISVTTPEILHSQARGVSLLNQQLIIFKSTNPLCTAFNIILQDFTIATKWRRYCAAQTHENVRIERQTSDIFCSIRRTGISCDNRQLYESNWTLPSSVTAISKKIYETRIDEWLTAWISPRVPSLGVDTERYFHPLVSSFHQAYKDPFIQVPAGQYSHTRKLEIITLAQENHVDIICLPPYNNHKL